MNNTLVAFVPISHQSVFLSWCSYDLLIACRDIGEGKLHVPELLGDVTIELITTEGAYDTKLDSRRVQNQRILQLLQRYTQRKSTFPQD